MNSQNVPDSLGIRHLSPRYDDLLPERLRALISGRMNLTNQETGAAEARVKTLISLFVVKSRKSRTQLPNIRTDTCSAKTYVKVAIRGQQLAVRCAERRI